MKVEQIFELVNDTAKNVLGKEEDVLKQDLTNVVDLGREIMDLDQVDNYVRKLVDHIGKVIFVNRVYSGGAPSVLMDSFEYGSILQKIQTTLPEAQENSSWLLKNGESIDPNIFYQPTASSKFFNSKDTFEIPMSFTTMQVKSSFDSPTQLNSFLSMIQTSVENAMTVRLDSLIMSTINNFTSKILADTTSPLQRVNLSTLYTQETGKTAPSGDKIFYDAEFLKYCAFTLNRYADRLTRISTLFNAGKCERFTPKSALKTVLLSDFVQAASLFLKSDTFHDNYISLPSADKVPYWQAPGNNYAFDNITKINVNDVEKSGIIGVMFDRQALGVSNLNKRVTSNYNPRAEFYSNWYKTESSYFNDLNENFIVFYVGDDISTASVNSRSKKNAND